VHTVSQWPNLRHLGEPLGGAKSLLEAVSFKKATESMGRGRVANVSWERVRLFTGIYLFSKLSAVAVCYFHLMQNVTFVRLISSLFSLGILSLSVLLHAGHPVYYKKCCLHDPEQFTVGEPAYVE